ncbi:MAG: CPBP family intramembrane glutamic endopeptidase, partial [Candidatus Hermodarchaeia archaeon]
LEPTDSETKISSSGSVLLWFFVLTFVLFIVAIVIAAAIPLPMLQLLPPCAPSIAAFIVILLILKERNGIRKLVEKLAIWRFGIGWYLAALSPFAIALLAIGLYIGLGNPIPGPHMPFDWITGLFWLIVSVVVGATGEELGWRGFALPRLQSRFNALGSSLILGVFWGFWHLPIYLLIGFEEGQFDFLNFLSYIMLIVFISIIITWIVNNTNGSVLGATIFHASFNFSLALFVEILGLIQLQWYFLAIIILYSIYAITIVIIYGYTHLSKESNT